MLVILGVGRSPTVTVGPIITIILTTLLIIILTGDIRVGITDGMAATGDIITIILGVIIMVIGTAIGMAIGMENTKVITTTDTEAHRVEAYCIPRIIEITEEIDTEIVHILREV